MSYGVRRFLFIITGLVLASLWIGFRYLRAEPWGDFDGNSDRVLLLGAVYFVFLIAPGMEIVKVLWAYKPGRVSGTVPLENFTIALLFVGLIGLPASLFACIHRVTGDDEDQMIALAGTLWGVAAWSLVAPVILALIPLGILRLRENISKNLMLRRLLIFGRGGSARWATSTALDRRSAKLVKDDKSKRWRTHGIYLGRSLWQDHFLPKHIGVHDDAHMLTVGQPGSGKSTTVIWPTLAMYSGPIIVVDPKGEHATACIRPIRSYKHILDPFDESGAKRLHRYNPLKDIDINNETNARGLLTAISQACVVDEGPKSQHWIDTARLLLEGVIAHVLSTEPEENHHLPFVFDLFQGIDPSSGILDTDRLNEVLVEMGTNPVAGGIAQQAASAVMAVGGDERGSFMSTLQRSIKWMSDPSMRKQLVHDPIKYQTDFRFTEFGLDGVPGDYIQDPSSLYIVLPTRLMDEYSRWLRVVVQVGLYVLQTREKPPSPPVLFVLDEFPKYGGSLKAIEDGIVTLRSYGIKLWPFIQNINQLKRDYPNNWQTFVSSSTVQAFGISDPETAEFIAKAIGERRVRHKDGLLSRKTKSVQAESLYTAREVTDELGKTSPVQIVLPNDGLPMRLERLAFKPLKVEGRRFRGLPLRASFKSLKHFYWPGDLYRYQKEYEYRFAEISDQKKRHEFVQSILSEAESTTRHNDRLRRYGAISLVLGSLPDRDEVLELLYQECENKLNSFTARDRESLGIDG